MATTTPTAKLIPDAFRRGVVRFDGTAPIKLHKDTLLDVTHPLTRQFKALVSKTSSMRTLDDDMNIAHIEWLAGMYHDPETGPYFPGYGIKRAITKAATRFKRSDPLKRGLVVVNHKIRLEYDGPRDLESLWDEGYRDMCGVVNSGRNAGRVMRCRPCFEDWALTVELAYDPKECDADTLVNIVELAQIRGIGDHRPEFGTFVATWEEV